MSNTDVAAGATPKRRWGRRVALVLLVLLVAVVGTAAYVFRPIAIPAPAALETLGGDVAQGKYLAMIGNCAACHTAAGGKPYAGGVKFKTPFGTLYSTNITPHRTEGIGEWTYAEFDTAMRHGLRPDGAHLYPAFPYTSFARMTDTDIASLYLYFRSIPAAVQENPDNDLAFPFGNRSLLYFWNRLFHDSSATAPDRLRSPQWNRGRYLVNAVAHCGACHTQRNLLGSPDTDKALQGGIYVDQVANGNYRQWAAVDLTPGSHGLKGWSARDITDYLLRGKNSHTVVHGPMTEVYESTRQLTRPDAVAIATYLRGTKPSSARLDWSFARSRIRQGEIVYTVHCGTCHLPSGAGDKILGVPLAQNAIVQAEDPSSLINVILYGPDLPPPPFASNRTTMKSFGKRLSDEDVAAVATYLRSSFGNNAPQVSPEQVQLQR